MGELVFEAHRLFVSLSLRLKGLLGPATRVKKKKTCAVHRRLGARLVRIDVIPLSPESAQEVRAAIVAMIWSNHLDLTRVVT